MHVLGSRAESVVVKEVPGFAIVHVSRFVKAHTHHYQRRACKSVCHV